MKYKHEWLPDHCHRTLNQYHNHCLIKLYDGRKRGRGNPPSVLHAVQCLKNMWRGGRVCEACASKKYIQLHHVDGQWWNYQLENLQFLCTNCHLAAHGGCWKNLLNGDIPMKWTEEKMNLMESTVAEICQKTYDMTPAEARIARLMSQVYSEISSRSEKLFGMQATSTAIQKVYEKKVLGRGWSPAATRSPRRRKTPTVNTTQHIMTVDDAIRIGRTIEVFEKFGITLSFNSYGA